jgi:hypothetical protein
MKAATICLSRPDVFSGAIILPTVKLYECVPPAPYQMRIRSPGAR